METKPHSRRLAAILYADVAGYSRLMGEDEDGTHRAVSAHLDLIAERVQGFNGRVGHFAGDAILADFDSVVDALGCALATQRDLSAENGGIAESRRVRFRIGINLGEVIADRGEVYGDGVNVAARLEALAEPGGVCASEAVRTAVGARLPVVFEFLGERTAKNIAEPLRAYHVRLRTGAELPCAARRRARWRPGWPFAATAALLTTIALGGAALWVEPWTSNPARSLADFSARERVSIAVLPFKTLGSVTHETYFGDGMTNDIIASLSRFSNLVVIASNSVFALKDTALSLAEVARALDVRYVVEGTLQQHRDRLRITAQLVDAASGRSLWSERFDRVREDVFELQDEITQRIVRALAIRLTKLERKRAFSKASRNLRAYEYVLRGRALLARLDRRANFEARGMFRKAIEIDPGYSDAYAGLGSTYHQPVLWGWTGSPTRDLDRALELARHAVVLDETSVDAHRLLGRLHILRREYDAALLELERVIALNPNDAQSHAEQGVVLLYAGRSEGALRSLETALRLDPEMGHDYMMHLGMSYFLEERHEESVAVLERSVAANPDNVFIHLALAAAYADAGQLSDARREAAHVRRLDPFFELDAYGGIFRDPADAARIINGLRRAGLQ